MIIASVLTLLAVIPAVLASFLALWKQFWISTEGRITSVDIHKKTNAEGKRVRHYTINYSYRIDDRLYHGSDSFAMDVPYYEEGPMFQQLAADFGPGDSITVFYPESVPDLGSARREVEGFGQLLLMTIVAVGMVVLGYFYFVARTMD